MAVKVFDAARVTLTSGETDVSTRVKTATLKVSNISVPTRTLGNTWASVLPTNQKGYTVVLGLQNDMTSSDVPINSILQAALSSQGSLAWSVRPTTAAQSATNPTFSGTASLDGEYDLFSANAEPAEPLINLTLKGNGTLTIATSST